MLTNDEKARIAEQLGILFSRYRTGEVSPEQAIFYVEDTADLSFRAVSETILRFRKGEIPGRNNAFPPSGPEFVAECRARYDQLQMEEFWEKTVFVEVDTPEWRAICEVRGRSMPIIERKGRSGWYVPRDEAEAVPKQIIENHRALLERREPVEVTPLLQRMSDG